MAQNLFEQYGLKEVANVTFYDIITKKPVLLLDTLKVSTIEQTADSVDAKGGIGNPTLITWDFNKEVALTLEDALMSPASIQLMTGAAVSEVAEAIEISTVEDVVIASGACSATKTPLAGTIYVIDNTGKIVDCTATDKAITATGAADGNAKLCYTFEAEAADNAVKITIDSKTFASTYKVVGETVIRSAKSGKDEPFQFVIEKAKVSSNATFTMSADGDPSTFSMEIRALKDDNNEMFKLIKYTK